jgi:tetratricopeptide (TPR) repeat protein
VDPGLIVGVVGAAAGVVAVFVAYLQLRRMQVPTPPLTPIEPLPDSIVHGSAGGLRAGSSGVHAPAPSAADFGLPVRVLTERLPEHVRGRGPLLRRLAEHLNQGGLVVLTGSGGMGKSTVARQLALQLPIPGPSEARPPVWEVSCADLPSLTGGLISIAVGLDASESDLQAIANLAPSGPDRFWGLLEEKAPKGWLLIIDNADNQEFLAAPALPGAKNVPRLHDGTGWARTTRRGLMLVTSRRRESVRYGTRRSESSRNVIWPDEARIYEVGPLSESEAARVLMDWAPRAGELREARALGYRLGGLPLALRLAGQYLSSEYVPGARFATYLRALDADPRMIRLLDPDHDDPERVEREMVMFTWELSLDALRDYGMPQARALLRLVCCYAPTVPIPLTLFSSELLEPLLSTTADPVGSSATADVKLDEVLRGLHHMGLIDSAILSGKAAGGTFDRPSVRRLRLNNKNALVVHPVIADTNRVYLLEPRPADPDPFLVRQTAVNLLAAVLDGLTNSSPTDWPTFRVLMPHLQALLANSAGQLKDDALEVLVRITGDTAMAYGQMRSAELGLDMVTSVLTRASGRIDDQKSVILIARQQRAHLLTSVGRRDEAERIYRHVRQVQRRFGWPDDDPAVMATRHNIAISMSTRERGFGDVKAHFEALLRDERRVLGDDDLQTLTTRLQLATLMCERDQTLQDAEAALRQLLADLQRVLGSDDLATLVTRHNLAVAVHLQGRQAEAQDLRRGLLEDEWRLVGEDHFLTVSTSEFSERAFLVIPIVSTPDLREKYARSQLAKGAALTQQRLLAEAVDALQVVVDRFGGDPDPVLREIVAKALLNIGIVRTQQEQSDQAVEPVERAVGIYEELAAADPDAFGHDLDSARQVLAEMKTLAARGSMPPGRDTGPAPGNIPREPS